MHGHDRAHPGSDEQWFGRAVEDTLRTCGSGLRLILTLFRRAWVRRIIRGAERLLLPGITAHLAGRKRAIREIVSGIPDGAPAQESRRVLILGAGLDPLGPWLAGQDPAASLVIEIDRHATHAAKSIAVPRVYPRMENLVLVGSDLARECVSEALARARVSPESAPTDILAEGLTMYLDDEQVGGLFRSLAALAAPSCRLIFTFLEPDTAGRIRYQRQSRLVDWWLRWRGEPFRWGIPRERLAEYLRPLGWELAFVVPPEQFPGPPTSSSAGRKDPLIEECLAVATRAS